MRSARPEQAMSPPRVQPSSFRAWCSRDRLAANWKMRVSVSSPYHFYRKWERRRKKENYRTPEQAMSPLRVQPMALVPTVAGAAMATEAMAARMTANCILLVVVDWVFGGEKCKEIWEMTVLRALGVERVEKLMVD